jgi:hypothetical protein
MAFTESLDDFEQSLLRFTTTIEENIQAIQGILDREEISAQVADKLMNILAGLEQYLDSRSTDLCEDLENHIRSQYNLGQKFTGHTKIVKDSVLGELVLLPPSVLNNLGWKPDDMLSLSLLDDGSVLLKKLPTQQG